MSKNTCFNQFLDQFGNRSKVYYDNEPVIGHDKALKLYLAEMAQYATTKQSRAVFTVDELIADAKQHKSELLKDKGKKVQPYKQEFISVSDVREDVASHSFKEHEERIVTLLAKEQIATEKFSDLVKEARLKSGNPMQKVSLTIKENKELRDEVEKFTEENPELFQHYKDEVKAKWDIQAKEGTVIHAVLDRAISIWNSYMTAEDPQERLKANELHKIIGEAKKQVSKQYRLEGEYDLAKVQLSEHLNDGIARRVRQIAEHINENYYGWKVVPELYLKSDTMTYKTSKGSHSRKVHGIADLVLFNEVTREAVVYEHKTKSEKSANSFDNPLAEYMKGPFSDHLDNAENQLQIQTSIISRMLEEKGYIVSRTHLSLLKMDLASSEHSKPPIERQNTWKYNSMIYDPKPITDYSPWRKAMIEMFGDEIEVEKYDVNIGSAIDEITGGNLEFTKDNRAQFIQKQFENDRVKRNDTTGRLTWFDTLTNSGTIHATSEPEMKQKLADVYEEHKKRKSSMPNDIMSYFRKRVLPQKSLMAVGRMSEVPTRLLAGGISNETHVLQMAKDMPGLSDVGDDVLVAIHKDTKEVTLMSLQARYNININFDSDGKNPATTIFGNYMNDEAVRKKFGLSEEIPTATVNQLTLLKLALVGSRLMKHHGANISKITHLKAMSAYSKDEKALQVSTMQSELNNLRRIRDIAGDNAPDALKELFEDKHLSKSSTYQANNIDFLLQMIQDGVDPLAGETHYGAKGIRNKLKEHMRDSSNGYKSYKLRILLEEYGEKLQSVLHDKYGGSKDAIAKDPDMQRYNEAYLSFLGLDVLRESTLSDRTLLGTKVRNLANSGDYYGVNLDRLIGEAQGKATNEMSKFVEEMNEKVTALYELYGISTMEQIFSKDAYRGFSNLFADNGSFNEGDSENWMKLKHENTPGLEKAEKDFIIFAKEKLHQGYKLTMSESQYKLYKKKIDDGYLPLQGPTNIAKLKNAKSMMDIASVAKDTLLTSNKKTSPVIGRLGTKLPFKFLDEYDDNPGMQGSKYRRDRMGIDEYGNKVSDRQLFEMNPVVIMTTFMLDAVQSKYLSSAAYAANAIKCHLIANEEIWGNSTEPMRKMIDNLTAIRLHKAYLR